MDRLFKIVLVALFSVSVFAHKNQLNKLKVNLHLKDYPKQMKLLQKWQIDIMGVDYRLKLVDVLATSKQIQAMRNAGFRMRLEKSHGELGVDEEYKSPDEIQNIMRALEQKHKNIMEMVKAGESLEGRPIWVMKISDNVKRDELNEPSILFNSMHHAREVMTPEASLDIIEVLGAGYGKDAKITEYVNKNVIWVMPMLNVDGNAKVWDGNNMWRKNTRGDYGVDINRNYPYKWGSCNGSSGSKWSQTYRGPSAGSEPETKVMMNLVKNIRPVFDLSFHSYSQLVIYPMGCKGERAVNAEVVEPIGKKLGEMLGYTAGTAWEILYSVDGGDIDWMNAEYQVIPYVFELNSRSEGFQPPYERTRDRTVKKIRKGWMYLLEKLTNNTVVGIVRNQKGRFARDGKVEVYKLEDGEYKYYTYYRLTKNGRFNLVLPKGKYRIQSVIGEKSNRSKEILVSKNIRQYVAIE
jgi:carboxypeptidase T